MQPAAQGTVRDPVLERALLDFEAAAPALADEIVPHAVRRRAAAQLTRLGWPSGRDEQWRYANLRAFEGVAAFTPAALLRAGGSAGAVAPAAGVELPVPLPGFTRLLYIDGVRVGDQGGGVVFPGRSIEPAWPPEQCLGLLGDMFAQDAALLRIDGEAAVELVFITSREAGGAAVYPRIQLDLAPASRLTLVERHLGAPAAPALVCATVTIELGRGAQLLHYRLQQCAANILFSDTLAARLQEDASYRVRQIALGALTARTSARVRLAGRGAALSWQAIAVGRTQQVHDTTLKVEHAAPATSTEEVFRGIANERARISFSGHIQIEPGAPGAQARQSLRGLIEGAGAEVDLRPRLEINTDEVRAQHGATTGRLDENLLFYLLSRGIDRDTARTLLKWAFLSDVLREIELPGLREQAERGAADQLQDVLAVGALA